MNQEPFADNPDHKKSDAKSSSQASGSESVFISARDILNKLKWHEDYDIANAEITYLHRGAPGDIMVIRGYDIIDIGKSFFTRYVDGYETSIPYHRVRRIEYEGEVLFSRKQVRERKV